MNIVYNHGNVSTKYYIQNGAKLEGNIVVPSDKK